MGCERCNGWMRPERHVGHSAGEALILGLPWRCVNRGSHSIVGEPERR